MEFYKRTKDKEEDQPEHIKTLTETEPQDITNKERVNQVEDNSNKKVSEDNSNKQTNHINNESITRIITKIRNINFTGSTDSIITVLDGIWSEEDKNEDISWSDRIKLIIKGITTENINNPEILKNSLRKYNYLLGDDKNKKLNGKSWEEVRMGIIRIIDVYKSISMYILRGDKDRMSYWENWVYKKVLDSAMYNEDSVDILRGEIMGREGIYPEKWQFINWDVSLSEIINQLLSTYKSDNEDIYMSEQDKLRIHLGKGTYNKKYCNYCKKKNHSEDECYNKDVSDELLDNMVRMENSMDDIIIYIGSKKINCKLDSSTYGNFMGYDMYRSIPKKYIIKETECRSKSISYTGPENKVIPEREVFVNIMYKREVLGKYSFYITRSKSCKAIIGKELMSIIFNIDRVKLESECIRSKRESKKEVFKNEEGIMEEYKEENEKSHRQRKDGIMVFNDKNGHKNRVEEYSSTYRKGREDGNSYRTEKKKDLGWMSALKDSCMSYNDFKLIMQSVDTVEVTGKIEPVQLNTVPGEYAWDKRSMPRKKLEEAQRKVREFMREGIIVPAEKSDWLMPVQIIKRPDGQLGDCLDLRGLNQITEQDKYPLLNITTITDDIIEMKYFTRIDTLGGFFSIPLDEKDQEKTTFKVDKSYYKFTVLPMSFRNAPNIIQRVIENILSELLRVCCVVYIDSILIYSKDMASHKEHIKEVLKKIKEYGMEVNWKKVSLAVEEIKYLGYRIGYNTIVPIESRSQGIEEYPVPMSKKQLKRFIGLLGCNRRFLWNISEILKPLHDLTRKDVPWKWTEIHQTAFLKAKTKLITATELVVPDYTKRFTLEVVASNSGVGAVLKQDIGVVGYYSTMLKDSKKNYTFSEKELFAVVWAIKRCKYYLRGVEFDLITDHQAITYCQTLSDSGNMRINTWSQILDDYSFIPNYQEKSAMIQADALSKSFCNLQEEKEDMSHPYLERIYNLQSEPLTEEEKVILQKHKEWDHRKAIRKELLDNQIYVTGKDLRVILDKCIICLERSGIDTNP
ncbi:hypothetical protein NEIRO03_1450 [Nematocida sp. AWRm78]|nr:hypothetical protein NEIRO02_2198 [Nematocida sp. AWRm79]KAI5183983.1 hypothetical protein NEIRO03_1450 [Nematocida sp. AWRm78]